MLETTHGLSEQEAQDRRRKGQGNAVRFRTGRSDWQILRANLFSFINTVLFGISAVLILLGLYGDAAMTAGLVLINVLVGSYQESRARRKLEKIALLTRPRAFVLRDAQEKEIDPGEIVLGDVLRAPSFPSGAGYAGRFWIDHSGPQPAEFLRTHSAASSRLSADRWIRSGLGADHPPALAEAVVRAPAQFGDGINCRSPQP